MARSEYEYLRGDTWARRGSGQPVVDAEPFDSYGNDDPYDDSPAWGGRHRLPDAGPGVVTTWLPEHVHDETRRQAGNTGRLSAVGLFWVLLGASVAVWAHDVSPQALTATPVLLQEAGRLNAMVAAFLLLVQIVMVSRVGWVERSLGSRELLRWHRWIGPAALLALLAHLVLAIVARGLRAGNPPLVQGLILLRSGVELVAAFAATAIILLVSVLAASALRRRMNYERWKWVHRTTYLAVYLGFGHQIALGRDLRAGPAHWFWIGLHLAALACLLWGRILHPAALNLRYRLRVEEVVWESPDMFSIYLTGRRLDRLKVRAGHHLRWRFLGAGQWAQSHPFSLSAAPRAGWLRLTVKAVGDHTSALAAVRPGTRVLFEGPFGLFTAERSHGGPVVLIGVGSGVAPIRALADVVPPESVVIYRVRSEVDLLFHHEWAALAEERNLDVRYVIGDRAANGPRALLTRAGLRSLVPDIAVRDVYLCGPGTVINGLVGVLRQLRVPNKLIHLDPFEY